VALKTRTHRGAAETMLVIEDDADLCGLICRLLLRLAYGPIFVRDARAARKKVAQREDIALVLADVVWPGAVGRPALAQAREAEGRTSRMLFTSGYADDTATTTGSPTTRPAVLRKPFSQADLATAIHDALTCSRAV
jgi:CheY-like chemotaxis protein